LGSICIDELDAQFTENLKIQLSRALKKEIQQYAITSSAPADNGKTLIQTKKQSDLELLIYYLQRGVLPWWVTAGKTVNLPDLLDKVMEKQAGKFISTLKKLNSIQTVERLVMQSTASTYHLLLKKFAIRDNHPILEAVKDWLLLLNKLNLTPRHISRIKTRLLYFLLTPPQNSSVAMLSEMIYQSLLANSLSATEIIRLKVIARKTQKKVSKNSAVVTWIQKQTTQPYGSENRESDSPQDSTAEPISSQEKPIQSSTQKVAEKQERPLKESQKQQENLEKEDHSELQKEANLEQWDRTEQDYYLANAGIVLLWPFLVRYFSKLKLIKDNAFTDENAQEKAVLILQFLATGNTESEEHALLLNKLLCGWPLEQPLLRSIALSKLDKHESEALIQSVIGHWKALKNTSLTGFRQSFLQREGRLTEKDHGWELFINRTGFDVLLDQLPWGIGTIHLPWMEKTVFVEW